MVLLLCDFTVNSIVVVGFYFSMTLLILVLMCMHFFAQGLLAKWQVIGVPDNRE